MIFRQPMKFLPDRSLSVSKYGSCTRSGSVSGSRSGSVSKSGTWSWTWSSSDSNHGSGPTI